MSLLYAKLGHSNENSNDVILKMCISSGIPTINIPDYTFDRDLFVSRQGPVEALYTKRKICGFLTSKGFARWDIENNNDSRTVDCFTYNESVLEYLDEYLFNENIIIHSIYGRICEACGEELNEGDDMIYCANDTQDEHGTCVLGRLHYRCRRGYLRIYPNVSRNFEDDDWICGHCESQNN